MLDLIQSDGGAKAWSHRSEECVYVGRALLHLLKSERQIVWN